MEAIAQKSAWALWWKTSKQYPTDEKQEARNDQEMDKVSVIDKTADRMSFVIFTVVNFCFFNVRIYYPAKFCTE